MKLYKLTRQDGTAYGGTQWSEGVTIKTSGRGKLCGRGYTHWYTHPLLAVILNPIHAAYKDPVLWEGEGEVVKSDGLKVGCKRATTIRRIPLPQVTTEQRVKFAILCALQVYRDPGFRSWAEDWLSGADRSWGAAQAAQSTMLQVARLAEMTALKAAVDAARAAREAAQAAREAALAEEWAERDMRSPKRTKEWGELRSLWMTALIKESEAYTAECAAYAAQQAARVKPSINLAGLAEQACADEENEK